MLFSANLCISTENIKKFDVVSKYGANHLISVVVEANKFGIVTDGQDFYSRSNIGIRHCNARRRCRG